MYEPPILFLLEPVVDAYWVPHQITGDPDDREAGFPTGLPPEPATEFHPGDPQPQAPGFVRGPLFRDQPDDALPDLGYDPAELENLDAELARLLVTAEQPAVADAQADGDQEPRTAARHRKAAPVRAARERPAGNGWSWRRAAGRACVLATGSIVVTVSALGAAASYPPLYRVAADAAPPGVAQLWPLLVYGPWIAGTLSILRARTHRRRSLHAWCVVVLFAAVAMALSVVNAPTTPAGITVAALPPATIVLCFHQLVRQLDLPTPPVPPGRHAHFTRGIHRQRPGR